MSKAESTSLLASDGATVKVVTARQREGLSLPLVSGSGNTVRPGIWGCNLLIGEAAQVYLFQKVLFLQKAGFCPEQLHQLTVLKCES